MPRTAVTHVRWTEKQKAAIARHARGAGISTSELIRRAVKAYLER